MMWAVRVIRMEQQQCNLKIFCSEVDLIAQGGPERQ